MTPGYAVMLRQLAAAALVAGVTLASAVASAAPPGLSSVPKISAGKKTQLSRPESIPAGERVNGISLVDSTRRPFGNTEHRVVEIRGASEQQCLRLAHRTVIGEAVTASLRDFSHPVASLNVPAGGVSLVRSERLIEGRKPQLELLTFWADARSAAAREVSRRVVPLKKLVAGPSGFAVYAYRTAKKLHLVLPGGEHVATQHGDGRSELVACSVATTTLDLTKKAATVSFAARLPREKRAKQPDGLVPAPVDGGAAEPVEQIIVQASVSVSRISTEKRPLLSVARSVRAMDHAAAFSPPAPVLLH